jgi:phosphoesterase RecJ-like protein
MRQVLDWIEAAPVVCIFRHQSPDADALGSQFGLLRWIQLTYPGKKVYAMGHHRGLKPQLYGDYEPISSEDLAHALAIILDTANRERIDDERYLQCAKRFKIDHHPQGDAYADDELIEVEAASTAEILTHLLASSKPLAYEVARYLYMGILSDTLRFSTANTRKETFQAAAYLMQSGLNLGQLNDDLFGIEHDEFVFSNYLRHKAIVEPSGLVYIILTLDVLKNLNVSPALAKEKIYEFNQVRSFKIWTIIIESDDPKEVGFNVSIRSRTHTINDIARRFGGGGHRLAAAAKGLSRSAVDEFLVALRQRIEGLD